MKRLQKIFFALSVIAGITVGCKNTHDIPKAGTPTVTPELGLQSVTVMETGATEIKATLFDKATQAYKAEVKTADAIITVVPKAADAQVQIDGTDATRHTVAFTEAEKASKLKTVTIKVRHRGSTASYTLQLNYTGTGAPASPDSNIREISITGQNGKNYPCSISNTVYTATVMEKTVTVKVVPAGNGAKVSIDGVQQASKEITFTQNGSEQTLKVKVEHKNKESEYTVKVLYNGTSAAERTVTVTQEGGQPVVLQADISDPRAKKYYADVTAEKAKVTVEPEFAEAEVTMNNTKGKTYELQFSAVGETKTIPVIITHQGMSNTFEVIVTYKKYNLTLNKIIVTDAVGNQKNAEVAEQTKYNAIVNTKTAKFKVETADSTAKVYLINGSEKTDITGKDHEVSTLPAHFQITVEKDNHKAVYTLKISYIEPDLRIRAIDVTGKDGSVFTVQSPSSTGYAAKVTEKNVTVKVTSNVPTLKVSIDNTEGNTKEISFDKEGVKTIAVKVSGYNTEAKYTLTLTYEAENVAIDAITLKDINGTVVTAAKKSATEYEAAVKIKNPEITVQTKNSQAVVTIDNKEGKTQPISFADFKTEKTIAIVVKHGTETKQFTLRVRCLSPDVVIPKEAELTNLSITANGTGIELTPTFSKTQTQYTAIIPADVSKITITAEAPDGITVEGAGDKTISEKNSIFTVKATVDAEPAKDRLYTITVTKAEQGASSSALLKTLDIKGSWLGLASDSYLIKENFQPNVTSYTYQAYPNVDGLSITAVPEKEGATMTLKINEQAPIPLTNKKKNINIPKGSQTKLVITVTAPDGKQKNAYTVTIEPIQSSFKLVELSSPQLDSFFEPNSLSKLYQLKAPANTSSITLYAKAEYPTTAKLFVTVNDNAEEKFTDKIVIQLTTDFTKIVVRVESTIQGLTPQYNEDKYTIQITKANGTEPNANLKELKVSYQPPSGTSYELPFTASFASDKTDYTVKVSSHIRELRIIAHPESPKAAINTWQGETTKDFVISALKDSTITVPVMADDGTRKVYTIKVEQFEAAAIIVSNVTSGQTVNTAEIPASGFTVNGTFTDPERKIKEIWVGTSALPIQQSLGNYWVKANVTETSFSATVPAIKQLVNGNRDIKVVAFANNDMPIVVTRIPIVITGNATQTAVANVQLNTAASLTAGKQYELTVLVFDETYAVTNKETVIVGQLIREGDAGTLGVPGTVQISDVMAQQGRSYFVEVVIKDKTSGKVAYYGVSKGQAISKDGSTSFTINVGSLQ